MMRRKVLILICFIMMACVSPLNAQGRHDWSKVINAIIQVESRGNTKAVSKDCVGAMQIRPILVKDVNEYLKIKGESKRYTLNDRFDIKKSKEMFTLYQERYNPTHNIERAIRLWNGGSNFSIKSTNEYYKKVMTVYRKKE